MSNIIKFFGSLRIQKPTKIATFYDDSASTSLDVTIGAGEYYLDHPQSDKSLIKILNTLLSGKVSLELQTNFQTKWTFADTNDYLTLEENKYVESLAYILGLYKQSDLKYFVDNNWSGTYTNISLSCVEFQSGVVYNGTNVFGFKNFNSEKYETQGGVVSNISFADTNVNTFKFNNLTQDLINGDRVFDTEDDFTINTHTFQNTVNNVFDFALLDNGLLFYFNGLNYQLYVKNGADGDKLKRRVQNWLGLWEFEFDANVVPLERIALSNLPDVTQWDSSFSMLGIDYLQPPFSVFMRVKLLDLSAALNFLFYIGSQAVFSSNFLLSISDAQQVVVYVRNSRKTFSLITTTDLLNNFHNFFITMDTVGNLICYYDGQKQTIATGYTSLYTYNERKIFLEWRKQGAYAPAGVISNLTGWSGRVLEETEVKEIFANRDSIMQKYKSGLVAHYEFQEGSGQKIYNQITEDFDTFKGGSWINED